MNHALGQYPAEPHGNRSVDLAAALQRVDRTADIGGVDAVQDADLAGDPVHREADAVHRERHGARRQVGPSLGLEAVAGIGPGSVQIGQRQPPLAADRRGAVEPAGRAADPGEGSGEVEDIVAQGRGGQSNRLAGDDRPGAAEGAGIIGGQIGVGVDDGDAVGRRVRESRRRSGGAR